MGAVKRACGFQGVGVERDSRDLGQFVGRNHVKGKSEKRGTSLGMTALRQRAKKLGEADLF